MAGIEFSFSGKPQGDPLDDQDPFVVLVVGDFSSDGGGRDEIGQRRFHEVDCDNFDASVDKIAPMLRLENQGTEFALAIESLESFHPDHIYKTVPAFGELRELRKQLLNPKTFSVAAARIREWSGDAPSEPTVPAEEPSTTEAGGGGSSFEDLLGTVGGGSPASKSSANQDKARAEVDKLVASFVGPNFLPSADPKEDELISAVDKALGELMHSILHHEKFKALEATWRGLDFLISRIDDDEYVKVRVLDARYDELSDHLEGEMITETDLYRRVVTECEMPGSEKYSLIVAAYEFEAKDADLAVMSKMGGMAGNAGAVFVAAARGDMTGENWDAFRRNPVAPFIGLVSPRMLLRLPYGKLSDAITSFEFEEINAGKDWQEYLWGNAVFAVVTLLVESFVNGGWGFDCGISNTLEEMPFHTYKVDGSSIQVPCAEKWLTDSDAEQILASGAMALTPIKGRDAVRIVRFQSIANPFQELRGRWG